MAHAVHKLSQTEDGYIAHTTSPNGTEGEVTLTKVQAMGLINWINGEGLIQNMIIGLTDDQREQLMSGYTPEEWDAMFPEDDEDNEPWEETWDDGRAF